MRTILREAAFVGALLCIATAAAQPAAPLDEAHARALIDAVVRVQAEALPDARSSETLGRSRAGTGIVIDERGRVLTIGYLVIEARQLQLTTNADRTVPARVAGYDHATGFALLEPLAPLGVKPIALGSSAALRANDAVMTLPFGGREAAGLARVIVKRPFTGSWEYLLDEALFVSPPTEAWAGAALIDRELRLVGVGSLLVRDVDPEGDQDELPGNMFVPIDLVKPILADLIERGKRKGAPRPWMGLATEEVRGHLIVTRVSPDGPADRAGVRRGDVLVAVAGTAVQTQAQLYRAVWALGAAGVEVPLTLVRPSGLVEVSLQSIDRAAHFREPPRQ